jgi:hypothetical protein
LVLLRSVQGVCWFRDKEVVIYYVFFVPCQGDTDLVVTMGRYGIRQIHTRLGAADRRIRASTSSMPAIQPANHTTNDSASWNSSARTIRGIQHDAGWGPDANLAVLHLNPGWCEFYLPRRSVYTSAKPSVLFNRQQSMRRAMLMRVCGVGASPAPAEEISGISSATKVINQRRKPI